MNTTKTQKLKVSVMKTKRKPKKAVIKPLKVVLVEQGSTIITHIYRSKESFRLDEKARYDRVIVRIIKGTQAARWTLRNRKNHKK